MEVEVYFGWTKSFWGRHKVDYLGHQVSLAKLEAHPKDLGSLVNIPFPQTLRSMQSFLGSLTYYSRFIEDFAIYASILYELREADYYEIGRSKVGQGSPSEVKGDRNRIWEHGDDPDHDPDVRSQSDHRVTGGEENQDRTKEYGDDPDHDPNVGSPPDLKTGDGDDLDRKATYVADCDHGGRSRWEKATIEFTLMKSKIASTPILKHFDPG